MLSCATTDGFQNDTRTPAKKCFLSGDYNFGSEIEAFFGQQEEDAFDVDNDSDESTEIKITKRQKGFNKDGTLRKERYYGQYKYVYWKKTLRKYKASFVNNKTTRVLGAFETEEEAASEINKQCIALGIPFKNPSIYFEKPKIALKYMDFEISQKYDGVLYLPKMKKFVGYLFLHKDEEERITFVKKRRTSKSNGLLYQDQYKFTGYVSTEIEAAKNINKLCRELNIPPKFPCISVYQHSSMRHKKVTRKPSRQQQSSLDLGLDDDAITEDEDFVVSSRKSYFLRKRKQYRKPNYVDFSLFDDVESSSHNNLSEPVYKKRKLNPPEENSLGMMCSFNTKFTKTPFTTPLPLKLKLVVKKKKEPLPSRSPSKRIAAQIQKKLVETKNIKIDSKSEENISSDSDSGDTTDSSILCETDEDEEITSNDGLSEYVAWNSHRRCWTVRIADRGNEFFVGNFYSKKHAINALIDYSNRLSIPLSDYFYSPEVKEALSSDCEATSEDEVMEDNANKNHYLFSPAYPVTMKLWALAGLCISREKQQNNSSKEFRLF